MCMGLVRDWRPRSRCLVLAVRREVLMGVLARPVVELFGVYPGYVLAGLGVNIAPGNAVRVEVDMASPTDMLEWSRTYNSLNTEQGPLGSGWTPALSARLATDVDDGVEFHDDSGRVLSFQPEGDG